MLQNNYHTNPSTQGRRDYRNSPYWRHQCPCCVETPESGHGSHLAGKQNETSVCQQNIWRESLRFCASWTFRKARILLEPVRLYERKNFAKNGGCCENEETEKLIPSQWKEVWKKRWSVNSLPLLEGLMAASYLLWSSNFLRTSWRAFVLASLACTLCKKRRRLSATQRDIPWLH